MNHRLIIHPGTGTILDAGECVIVETDLDETDLDETNLDEVLPGARPADLMVLDETHAVRLVARLARRLGWQVAMLTRRDAEDILDDIARDQPIDDAMWERLSTSPMWRDIEHVMSREGFDAALDAVGEWWAGERQ